mgnify:CR=1 FL=1
MRTLHRFRFIALPLRRFGVLAARRLADSRGVTTAEYALLLALVVIVLISSLSALGATLQDKLQSIIDVLTGVSP